MYIPQSQCSNCCSSLTVWQYVHSLWFKIYQRRCGLEWHKSPPSRKELSNHTPTHKHSMTLPASRNQEVANCREQDNLLCRAPWIQLPMYTFPTPQLLCLIKDPLKAQVCKHLFSSEPECLIALVVYSCSYCWTHYCSFSSWGAWKMPFWNRL